MYKNTDVNIDGNKVKLMIPQDSSRYINFWMTCGQIEATLMHDFGSNDPIHNEWDAEKNVYPYNLRRIAETGDLIEDSLDWMVFTHANHDEAFSFIVDRVKTVFRVLMPEVPYMEDVDANCVANYIFKYYLDKTYNKTKKEVIDHLFAEIFSGYNDEKMKEKFLLSKKMLLS